MRLLLSIFALLSSCSIIAQTGHIDTTFNSTDVGYGAGDGARGLVLSHAIQADGKFLIGGNFDRYNNVSFGKVARLNANGYADTSYKVGSGANGFVYSILPLNNGKTLIGGLFTQFNGVAKQYIAMLQENGSLDTTFSSGFNNGVKSIKRQSDGKIIVAGYFSSYKGMPARNLVRILPDGTLDPSFSSGTGAFEIIVMEVLPGDKILIAGSFTHYNGVPRNSIAILHPDGELDMSFDPGVGANNRVAAAVMQPDGKIVLGGAFTSFNQVNKGRIVRLLPDGSLDPSFNTGTGFDLSISSLHLLADGKIMAGGAFDNFNGMAAEGLARLLPDGSLDNTFFNPEANAVTNITPLSNGKLLLTGDFTTYGNKSAVRVARILENGTLDSTFNTPSGINSLDGSGNPALVKKSLFSLMEKYYWQGKSAVTIMF